MKWLNLKELDATVKVKSVIAYEQREVFNTTFNAMWTMTGMVFDDNSFVAIYSEGEESSYLFFENGK